MERLFVYGTLAPNKPNEHILKELEGTWEYSTVKGNLYKEGWGSDMGYPGIVLNDKGNNIQGLVFSSTQLNNKWDFLDNFEGKEYKRVLTKAKLLTSEEIETYIYALNK